MNFLPLIEAKREGEELRAAQISEIIGAYSNGKLPDYQMAAFLMAVFFRGLTKEETRALTLAMRDSGEKLKFPADSRPLVDKHSTGGVGDKVSLPLAPLLACVGFRVPMISGRGLGITGGTLDKLDSIPGFRTSLSCEQIVEIVQKVGCAICGQTEQMVPADRGLYALRDATGTVPSIPLIVSSILSKKLAEGLEALILDVKCGTAAFMPTTQKARELASAMVTLGNDCGVKTRALITAMDAPLGRAAGNWLEVKESVAFLSGESAGKLNDVEEIVLLCAAHLLVQTGRSASIGEGRKQAAECVESGQAREKWNQMIVAQSGDPDAIERKLNQDHTAAVVVEIKSPRSAYISRCNARVLGEVIRDLGGGRLNKESRINYDVGLDRLAKPGDQLRAGDVLARVHAADKSEADAAANRVVAAFEFSDAGPAPCPIAIDTILPEVSRSATTPF